LNVPNYLTGTYTGVSQASGNKPEAATVTSPRRSTSGNVTSLPPPPPPAAAATRRSRDRACRDVVGRYACTLYVLVRVAYSVAFTFTTLYVGLAYLVGDDLARLSGAAHLQWDQRNASAALGDVVRRRWHAERQRQASLVDTQRHACAHYVDDLTGAVAAKLDDALTTSRRRRRRYDVAGQSPTTVTAVVELRLLDGLGRYARALTSFKRRYRKRLAGDMAPSLRSFADYLSSVERSDWLGFARALFNRSVATSGGVEQLLFHGAGDQRFQAAVLAAVPPATGRTAHGLNVSGSAADFAGFIDIQEVDEIQLWSRQFWERSAVVLEPATNHKIFTDKIRECKLQVNFCVYLSPRAC